MKGISVPTRVCFAWLLLLALVLQGLMPPGYMPDFSRPGQMFAITICTGTGQMKMMAPGQHQDHRQNHDNTPCSFGINSLMSFGNLPNAPLILLILSFVGALFILTDLRLPLRRINASASARAPPYFS